MPRPRKRSTPKLCKHHRGSAFVTIDRRTFWIGTYGSEEAQQEYDRLIAAWLSNGRRLPPEDIEQAEPMTITQLCVEYWKWAEPRQPNKGDSVRLALRLLRKLYGSTSAGDFGPVRLRTLRDQLIRDGLARSTITERVRIIKGVFRYAVANELFIGAEATYSRLMTLEPLRARDVAKPGKRVRPVPRADLRRTWPHLSRPVRGLVLLQLLTGARPGELLNLAATDIDRGGAVWTFTLVDHKNAHRDQERVIYFGPRAQRVLGLFSRPGRPLDKPLFSPREAMAEANRRRATTGKGRRPNQKPNPKTTDRAMGEAYTSYSYRQAIHNACRKAKVAQWSPHRLRHNAGTAVRKEFGLEAAQAVLGHKRVQTTQIYAEVMKHKAIEAITKIG